MNLFVSLLLCSVIVLQFCVLRKLRRTDKSDPVPLDTNPVSLDTKDFMRGVQETILQQRATWASKNIPPTQWRLYLTPVYPSPHTTRPIGVVYGVSIVADTNI